jgi:formylglycine-generating enzyme required for sulfatase activity
VSFSPDGKRIVSGSYDNTVKVWDAQTGQETLTLKIHSDDVTSVSFSPDGKRIVSGSYDNTVKVWDAQTGQETRTLKGHSDWVSSVSFSPDGKRIVSGSYDNTVKVWDLRTVRVSVPIPKAIGPPLAVAPFDTAGAVQHQQAWADHLGTRVETTNSIGMKFMVIPPGEFMMGSPESEKFRDPIERLHKVTLSQPFELGLHEVTQQQYEKVMGKNPSRYRGANNPVDSVTWIDAVEFCRRLSELPGEKTARRVYRLPTEAEWEYACRAGTSGSWCCGDGALLPSFAWVASSSQTTSHPVGQLAPNAWGLFDVHGNVVEHCEDWYASAFYNDSPGVDPTGPARGMRHVLRGGAWDASPIDCRSADRDGNPPIEKGCTGFRVVRSSVK